MKRKMISQLKENDVVGDFFVVTRCDKKTTRTNKPYLDAQLADASGKIIARVWDNVDKLAEALVPGKIVRLEASIDSYQNNLQMKILDARPLRPDDKIDPADFMAKTPYDIDHLFHKFLEYKNSIANPKIRQLVDYFFENDEFVEKFKKHPAAKAMHHAYVGGLLEHTVTLVHSCDNLAKVYSKLNRDISQVSISIALEASESIDLFNMSTNFSNFFFRACTSVSFQSTTVSKSAELIT